MLPVFGVGVSVAFRHVYVRVAFGSVSGCWVATFWEIAACSVDHMFYLWFGCLWC